MQKYIRLDSMLRALWPESEATARPLAELVATRLLQLARKGQLRGLEAGTCVPVNTQDLADGKVFFYTTLAKYRQVSGQVVDIVKQALEKA